VHHTGICCDCEETERLRNLSIREIIPYNCRSRGGIFTVLPQVVRHAVFRQIIQNTVIFLGVLFAHQWASLDAGIRSCLAFCILSLFSYTVIFTVHSIKSDSNQFENSIIRAVMDWPAWLKYSFIIAVILSILIRPAFGSAMVIYVIIAFAHDMFFSQRILLDVIILSIEFSLKAIAGVVALKNAQLSPWLVACAFLLSLVVSLGKRRNELRFHTDNSIPNRAQMTGYTDKLLDQMLAVVTSSTFLAYTLYTISSRTKAVFGHTHLVFTIPFVLYGILRYLYIVNKKDMIAGSEIEVLKDVPMLINILLWISFVVFFIRFPD
jgi:hypothetical protein